MSTFISNVKKGILAHKARNAFFIKGKYISYDELDKRIGGITETIQTNIKGSGQCIGIIEKDNIQTYASLLAVLLTGNTYVIINPNNPADRNLKIIQTTEMGFILSSDQSDSDDYLTICKIINTNDLANDEGIVDIPIKICEDQLAYIIFTSGSTGEPKGVPITHKNLNAFYEAYNHIGFQLTCEDRMLQVFDLCFDPSVVSTLHPLTLGACIYTVNQIDVKYTQVYELLEDEELTFAAIPPSLLSYLQPYFDEIDLPSLRYLILTAEASRQQLIAGFSSCIPNAEIVNLYGPTEGTIYCSCYKVPQNNAKHYNGMLAIGTEFAGTTAIVVNDNNQEVKTGQKGELCISGDQILNAYWKNPEKTAEVTLDIDYNGTSMRFYRTGDLCYKDETGCIFYCGRLDYQVQIQGFRIELNELEQAVRQFHITGDNVTLPHTNAIGNLELHLFLEKFDASVDHLMTSLKELLPPYMVPHKTHIVNNFPLNTSGKIDRKQLLTLIEE